MGLFDLLFRKKIIVKIPSEGGDLVEKKISKKMFDELVAQGIIKEIGAVQAHILDPMKGYYVSNWVVGEDIDRKTVMEFATETKDLYVIIAYKKGETHTMVTKKEVWEKQKGIFKMIERGKDCESELKSLLSEVKEKINKENND